MFWKLQQLNLHFFLLYTIFSDNDKTEDQIKRLLNVGLSPINIGYFSAVNISSFVVTLLKNMMQKIREKTYSIWVGLKSVGLLLITHYWNTNDLKNMSLNQ